MASQSYIIAREDIIRAALDATRNNRAVDYVAAASAVRECREAYAIESTQGRNDANRDCWGTLGVNVVCLGRYTIDTELRMECKRLADELDVHGRD